MSVLWDAIRQDNAWWASGVLPQEIKAYPRRRFFESFFALVEPLENRRAVVLMGPRRVGKTLLMRQALQELLDRGIPARQLAYLSVDSPLYSGYGLEELFQACLQAAQVSRPEGYYLFLDEIQYVRDWERHLKVLVDKYPQTKFVVSGSAAAALKLKSQESGAGRFTDFLLPPLTFYEYLLLQGKEGMVFPSERQAYRFATTHLDELNEAFLHYLNWGGYPELVFNPYTRSQPERFVREDIVEKVLARDLPNLYGISDSTELYALFNTLAFNTGSEISLEALSKQSGLSKPTLLRYLEFLQAAFLVKILPSLDQTGRRFKRENFFKLYLGNTAMRSALFSPLRPEHPQFGQVVETVLLAQLDTPLKGLYYARWGRGEVDLVGLDALLNVRYALEIKWSDRYAERWPELKSLREFLSHQTQSPHNLVTTITQSAEVLLDSGQRIEFIPMALWACALGFWGRPALPSTDL